MEFIKWLVETLYIFFFHLHLVLEGHRCKDMFYNRETTVALIVAASLVAFGACLGIWWAKKEAGKRTLDS